MTDLNPQREQMADESMVRTLAAQVEAIWPQELPLLARYGTRVAFEHRSVFETGLPDGAFDLTVCRHVIQSVPFAERVLAELTRVTRSGGWLHVIAEDYDEAWRDGYAKPSSELTRFSLEEATAHFDAMITNIRDPNAYAVWLVPVISGRVP